MMRRFLTHRSVVYPTQCDHNGHVNVMWCGGKFDEATWRLFADLGIGSSYLRKAGRGMFAAEQSLAYKRELFAGDTLVIHSAVVEVRQRSLKFEHIMWKNGEDAEAATSTYALAEVLAAEGGRP